MQYQPIIQTMVRFASLQLLLLLALAGACAADVPAKDEIVAPSSQYLRSSRQKRGLVIGGNDADNDRYPYFTLMNRNALCGAVLISPNFILTAAHCVGADTDFQVGVAELSFWGSSNKEEFSYVKKIVHPEYDSDSVANDIAIYELSRPVSNTVYTRISNIPVQKEGTPLTVIGFGDTDPSEWIDNTSNELLEATVGYVPQTQCRQSMGFSTIADGMLCAFSPKRDACSGDSGGPLLKLGDTPEKDELVGLVSWGVTCADDTYPGVYTRISHYYDWIVSSMCAMNPNGVPLEVECGNTETIPSTGVVVDNNGGGNGDDDDDLFSSVYNDDDNDFFASVWTTVTDWYDGIFGW